MRARARCSSAMCRFGGFEGGGGWDRSRLGGGMRFVCRIGGGGTGSWSGGLLSREAVGMPSSRLGARVKGALRLWNWMFLIGVNLPMARCSSREYRAYMSSLSD